MSILKEIVIERNIHQGSVVYFLIRENKIVYIGQTQDLLTRCNFHESCKDFDRVLYFECAEDQVNEIERRLIFEFTPEYNTEWYDRSSGWSYKPEDIIDRSVVKERASELKSEDRSDMHVLDRPITSLNLSARTLNRLIFKNVRYVGDIQGLGANGVLGFAGIGSKSLDEIRAVMESIGVEFD